MAEKQGLKTVPLFAELPADRRAVLEAETRWRRFEPQEQIIDRDSDGREVFVLVSGRVRIVIYSATGREIAFDDLTEGAIFGELAALDPGPRSANVVAIEHSVVGVIAPHVFRRAVSETPAVALAMMQHLASLVRRSTDRILDLSTLGANNRVQAEILRLARSAGGAARRAEITPIPIHADIAARVSTTRETVARVFSDLTRDNIVERLPDRIVVRDVDRLAAMVEEFRGA